LKEEKTYLKSIEKLIRKTIPVVKENPYPLSASDIEISSDNNRNSNKNKAALPKDITKNGAAKQSRSNWNSRRRNPAKKVAN